MNPQEEEDGEEGEDALCGGKTQSESAGQMGPLRPFPAFAAPGGSLRFHAKIGESKNLATTVPAAATQRTATAARATVSPGVQANDTRIGSDELSSVGR